MEDALDWTYEISNLKCNILNGKEIIERELQSIEGSTAHIADLTKQINKMERKLKALKKLEKKNG